MKTPVHMKLIHFFVVLVLLFPNIATSQEKNTSDVPLIDREIFFGNPVISGGQLSPVYERIQRYYEYLGEEI